MTARPVQEIVFHAALLAGRGAESRAIAQRAASAAGDADARTCLDAGAPLQFTVDAAGFVRGDGVVFARGADALAGGRDASAGSRGALADPAGRAAVAPLRYGVRLGGDLGAALSAGGVAAEDAACLVASLAALAPSTFPVAGSYGRWLFTGDGSASLFVDVRDGSPRAAALRVRPLLDDAGAARLERSLALTDAATPWTLRLKSRGGALVRVHLHWLVHRSREPGPLAAALGRAAEWEAAAALLAPLLFDRPSARTGPWVIAVPLDAGSAPGLRIGTSAWARRADDARKGEALNEAFDRLCGPRGRDRVEPLFSLLTGAVPPGTRWRVGRALEVRALAHGATRLRAFLVPRAG